MNQLVGEKLSIVSSKAQTTRHRILGIVNEEDVVFGIVAHVVDLADHALAEGVGHDLFDIDDRQAGHGPPAQRSAAHGKNPRLAA